MKPLIHLFLNDPGEKSIKHRFTFVRKMLKTWFICLILLHLGLVTALKGINSLTPCQDNYVFALDMVKSKLINVVKIIEQTVFSHF